ncbi:MAG: helix-turn-helix transcriptional regulator [Minicystis sp.]
MTDISDSFRKRCQEQPLPRDASKWEHQSVTLALRLKKAREAKDLGTRELARLAGTTGGTISRMEGGALGRSPSVDMTSRLAVALGVRADWLLSGEGPMESEASAAADPCPHRTEAVRLAREADVLEQAIRAVLEEPIPPGAETKPTLWWTDKMRARAYELVTATGELARIEKAPPVSARRPTAPPEAPAEVPPAKKRKSS